MLNLPSAEKRLPAEGDDPARTVLNQAFKSFLQTAGSLEASYASLQAEIRRLRDELEIKNSALARSLAQNELMRTYLGSILEALPCGVLVADKNLAVKLSNPGARQLLGWPASGEPANTVPGSLASLMSTVARSSSHEECYWQPETGEEARTIAINCAPLPKGSSAQGECVFILRDITEQRRLEREREVARRMRALADMTALLAHEIRNPLASLELFAGLIQGAVSDNEEARQWAIHLHAGLRGLSATVNNVLHFYTQAPPQTKPVSVADLLDHTVQFLQPLALQRGMAIEWQKPASPYVIQCDPHRLQQVFFNLAINAFRAMTPGARLTVRLGTPANNAGTGVTAIEFEDQGSGISAGDLERIFQPGFTTRPGSPGLGLAVCRKVMEEHGGKMSVASVPGQGTKFTLTFPAGAPRQEQALRAGGNE